MDAEVSVELGGVVGLGGFDGEQGEGREELAEAAEFLLCHGVGGYPVVVASGTATMGSG